MDLQAVLYTFQQYYIPKTMIGNVEKKEKKRLKV